MRPLTHYARTAAAAVLLALALYAILAIPSLVRDEDGQVSLQTEARR